MKGGNWRKRGTSVILLTILFFKKRKPSLAVGLCYVNSGSVHILALGHQAAVGEHLALPCSALKFSLYGILALANNSYSLHFAFHLFPKAHCTSRFSYCSSSWQCILPGRLHPNSFIFNFNPTLSCTWMHVDRHPVKVFCYIR